jgi:hypothetical protein
MKASRKSESSFIVKTASFGMVIYPKYIYLVYTMYELKNLLCQKRAELRRPKKAPTVETLQRPATRNLINGKLYRERLLMRHSGCAYFESQNSPCVPMHLSLPDITPFAAPNAKRPRDRSLGRFLVSANEIHTARWPLRHIGRDFRRGRGAGHAS